jgi:hypothetical protein
MNCRRRSTLKPTLAASATNALAETASGGENAGFRESEAVAELRLVMVFENIEKLQREWTDKYVVVDESRPELRRFRGMTGTVKTVNFSGKALVQFDANNNIAWYDIDPSCLKVIDAPLPKAEPKAEAKPKAAKPVTEAKAAAPKPDAKKPDSVKASGMSVADMLAAARGNKPAAPKAEAPSGEKKSSTADILAAARSKPGTAPAAEAPAAAAKVDPM